MSTYPYLYIIKCLELPDPLEPNRVYCVKRDDTLFDIYFTNETAEQAYHLITKEEIQQIISQMSVGSSVYKGLWNADTNTPTLVSGVGTTGDFYRVGTAGNTTIDGNTNWQVNDIIVFDGVGWDKVSAGSTPVYSVAGKTGDVTLTKGDVGLSNVDNVQQLPHTQTLAVTGDVTANATALNTGTIQLTLQPGMVMSTTEW